MKKKLLLLSALLIVCACITYVSFAWLTDTDTKTVTYSVGDVEYTLTSPDTSTTITIVPGQTFFNATAYTLTNTSTVVSDLRIKVTVTGTEITKDHIVFSALTRNWAQGSTDDGCEGYYVLSGIAAGPGAVTFPFETMALDGTKVGNAFSGKTFTVTILFEAKQHDHVTWQNLGSFSFETGLAA